MSVTEWSERTNRSCQKGGILETIESLIGNKIGSLYVLSQIDDKVYCYCSNCGNNNIECSYNKIMYCIRHNKNITCGCKLEEQSNTSENLIGVKYKELTIVKQKDNEIIECRCRCGKVFPYNINKFKNNDISMCNECMKNRKTQKEQTLIGRNRKELYFIWKKYKQLYEKPTKNFKREIIDNEIKFFPNIWNKENEFEFFYQWAIISKYGERSGVCYLDRKDYLEDYNETNCYWTYSKCALKFFEFPKFNEER